MITPGTTSTDQHGTFGGKRASRAELAAVGAVLTAAFILFVSQCIWVGDVRIDDAYFTFSFAKNFALGEGPLYSHGVRAEGYSTFLWMLLMAVPLAITRGIAPVPAARVMGAPFVLLLGWATYHLARACGASRLGAALAVLLLAFNTDTAVAYLTGMETAPFMALLAAGFVAVVRSFPWALGGPEPAAERCERWRRLAPFAALAVGLMRIDGFVAMGFLLGCTLLRDLLARREQPLRDFVRLAGPAVALYAGWFLWRWHYYGLPLPSTYYAKALIPKLLPNRGLEYVSDELLGTWLIGAFLALPWHLLRRNLPALLLLCFSVGHVAYVIRVGGDWMPFGRFVLPIVPLVVAAFAGAASQLVAALRGRAWLVRGGAVALSGGVAVALAVRMDHRFVNDGIEAGKIAGVAEQTRNVKGYLHAATFLQQIVPAGGRLVSDYGGVFGYHTDAAVIEMWGLANPTIALRGHAERINPIYGKTCPACYPELRPEYFHVVVPLTRAEPAFRTFEEVLANVWQTDTIGRYIDFTAEFVAGKVVRPDTNEALYFLQRRVPGLSFAPRTTKDGFVISYPFEPSNWR